jgi:arylformamidase
MLFDISVSLQPSFPHFPGDPPNRLEPAGADSDFFHISSLSCSSHAGTHLDMPGHVGLWGNSAASASLELLIGPCQVLDLSHVSGLIGPEHLRPFDLSDCRRLLFKTSNSHLWKKTGFCSDYRALSLDGAHYLGRCGIDLVGIDYLSIEAWDGNGEVHHRLLRDGCIILEGLDLSAVSAGRYELICLPLKLSCTDGAPCRALLRL